MRSPTAFLKSDVTLLLVFSFATSRELVLDNQGSKVDHLQFGVYLSHLFFLDRE